MIYLLDILVLKLELFINCFKKKILISVIEVVDEGGFLKGM